MSIETFFTDIPQPENLQYVAIMASYRDKWVWARHKERDTYEMPGGHIESGEQPLEAARRELFEETGATKFDIYPICDYGVSRDGIKTYGSLFFAYVTELADMPDYEMAEISLFDKPPERLTYPEIQPLLFTKAKEWLSENPAYIRGIDARAMSYE